MKKLLTILILTATLWGCASLQKDLVVSSDSFTQTEDILYFEKKFSQLDSKKIFHDETFNNEEFSKECNILISEIQTELDIAGVQKEVSARLFALQGKTYLLQNKKSKALELYKVSLNSSKGDSQTIILGSRLGLVESLEDENLISGANENALLILERGLKQYETGKFSESAALLDSSFLELPDFYQESYYPVRENAWRLKEIDDSSSSNKVISILQKKQITVGQMLLITQDSTQLMFPFTAGKTLSESEIFATANKSKLLNPVSNQNQSLQDNQKKTELKPNQIITRIIAARFLWNLYCQSNQVKEEATKYSQMITENGIDSPVADISTSDPDFDAVLGCIENEFMSLTDGLNFYPSQNPTAAEFHEWIRKL